MLDLDSSPRDLESRCLGFGLEVQIPQVILRLGRGYSLLMRTTGICSHIEKRKKPES